jgi:LPS-assembly lipoprotein
MPTSKPVIVSAVRPAGGGLRRRFVLAGVPALALSACGFQLRQAPHFVFRTIYIRQTRPSALGDELRRSIAAVEPVRVLTEAAQIPTADVVLELLTDQREKVVVGVNASGQVREFQLRVRLKFRLRTPQDKDLIADTELLQQRDFSYNETAALAKEVEEAALYRSMQTDLVQQVLRRLAAVSAL